jgi:hypothetical protein
MPPRWISSARTGWQFGDRRQNPEPRYREAVRPGRRDTDVMIRLKGAISGIRVRGIEAIRLRGGFVDQ